MKAVRALDNDGGTQPVHRRLSKECTGLDHTVLWLDEIAEWRAWRIAEPVAANVLRR